MIELMKLDLRRIVRKILGRMYLSTVCKTVRWMKAGNAVYRNFWRVPSFVTKNWRERRDPDRL